MSVTDTNRRKLARQKKKVHVYMRIASDISALSTCASREVGGVFVGQNGYVQTVCYNGPAHGEEHCIDKPHGCVLDERGACADSLHAEENGLLYLGERAKGSTLYITHRPCYRCTMKLAHIGISAIYYRDGDFDVRAKRLLTRHSIRYIKYPGEL